MDLKVVVVLVLFCLGEILTQTVVEKCPGERRTSEELHQIIKVGNCKKPPCRLRKGRTVNTEFKFTPEKEVKSLTNTVNAVIVGIPFPFIGVDGTNACEKVYETDGSTKADCPLQAGKEYVYKDSFKILDIYPILKLVVHWGLTADDGKDVMCFQVPARISN